MSDFNGPNGFCKTNSNFSLNIDRLIDFLKQTSDVPGECSWPSILYRGNPAEGIAAGSPDYYNKSMTYMFLLALQSINMYSTCEAYTDPTFTNIPKSWTDGLNAAADNISHYSDLV